MVTAAHGDTLADWLTGLTGKGTAAWTKESAEPTYHGDATFAWAVLPGTSVRDGFVQVSFKPIDGRKDRAGGVVWRGWTPKTPTWRVAMPSRTTSSPTRSSPDGART